jgi:type VI secretion system protein VasG
MRELPQAMTSFQTKTGRLVCLSEERPEVQEHVAMCESIAVPESAKPDARQALLDRFTQDLTARAQKGQIDPVFGRDDEIRQVIDILSRRRKNNPILVGEPGVGKNSPRVLPKATYLTVHINQSKIL